MKINRKKLSRSDLLSFIRLNGHLTMKQLSDRLNVPRYRINNCVFNHGLIIRRCKGTDEEIAHRIEFVRNHSHLTRSQCANELGMTSSSMGAMCKKYNLKTVRSRFDVSQEEFARMREYILSNPHLHREDFSRKFSVSSTTIGRLCEREGIVHAGMRQEVKIPSIRKVKNKKVQKPTSLINKFLMGNYKNVKKKNEI